MASEFNKKANKKIGSSLHALRESVLDNILAFSKDHIFILDKNKRFTYVSSAGAEVFGYKSKELIGKKWADLKLPHEVISPFNIRLNAVFSAEKPLTGETIFRVGKEPRIYEYILSPVRDKKGEIESVVAISRDITKRKQIEEALIRSRQRLEAVRRIGLTVSSTLNIDEVLNHILAGTLEAAGATVGMIFLKDLDTEYLRWGASIGLSEAFVEAYRKQLIKSGEGLTGRIAQNGEIIYIAKDSSHDPRIARPVVEAENLNTYIGVPIRAEADIVGVMNILTRPPDVLSEQEIALISAIGTHVGFAIRNAKLFTKSNKLQEALKESEEKFRTIFERGPLGIILLGKDKHFLSANNMFRQMVSYSEEELKEMTFEDITLPEDMKVSKKTFSDLFSGKSSLLKLEKRYIRKDGEIIWVNLTSTAICDEEGKVKYLLTMFEDITERKRFRTNH